MSNAKKQYVKKVDKIEYNPPFMEDELKNNVTLDYASYSDRILDVMNEYGFVVVTGILTDAEIDDAQSLLFDDLVNTIDIDKIKNDKNCKDFEKTVATIKKERVWPKKSFPGIASKGFLSTMGMAHGQYAWKMRTNKKCKEIYKVLHGCDDLVVSFDIPFYLTTGTNKVNDLWPHADQNINLKKGSENSYQGILYASDATVNNSSNTIVWPKSHKNEYYTLLNNCIPKDFNTKADHALYIDTIPNTALQETLTNEFVANSRRVDVPKGGIIIFNSRTIHQGYPAGYRLAQPLAWEPTSERYSDAYRKRLEAINMGCGTTHWASLGIMHGASFIRPLPPKYSDTFNSCILPMKRITPVPIKRWLNNINKIHMIELEQNIKDEYKEYI
jgi:hypothetical protein